MANANEAKLNARMRLIRLQNEIKAPKNEYNNFAKFNYRTTSEILRGIKPLCDTYHLQLMTSTECVALGWGDTLAGVYQKATANLLDADNGELIAASTAMAREDGGKNGMSAPQASASAAQFAVKRALEQLLMLDDSAPEVDAQPQQVQQFARIPYEPFAYDSDGSDYPHTAPRQPQQARPVQQPQARPAQPRQAPAVAAGHGLRLQPMKTEQQARQAAAPTATVKPAAPVQGAHWTTHRVDPWAMPAPTEQAAAPTAEGENWRRHIQQPAAKPTQQPAKPAAQRTTWGQNLKDYDAQQKAAAAKAAAATNAKETTK